jgi:hypothetical protein
MTYMSLQGGRHTYAAALGVGIPGISSTSAARALCLMPYALFRALCPICHLCRCPWRRASQASAARQQPEPSARLPPPAIYLYPPHPPRASRRLGRALPTFSVSICIRLVPVKPVNPTPVAASESQGTRCTRAPAGSLYCFTSTKVQTLTGINSAPVAASESEVTSHSDAREDTLWALLRGVIICTFVPVKQVN